MALIRTPRVCAACCISIGTAFPHRIEQRASHRAIWATVCRPPERRVLLIQRAAGPRRWRQGEVPGPGRWAPTLAGAVRAVVHAGWIKAADVAGAG